MSVARPRLWRWCGWLAAGAACGVLVALSVPPFGWWPLAWCGFAGIALLLPRRRLPVRVAIGFGAGLGQFVPGLWWVQEFSVWGCVALIVLGALFFAAALALVPSRRRRGVALGMPALLMLSAWARDRFPLHGFPLAGAALGQAASPLAASARFGGSLLLTGVTVLAGVALADLVQAGRSWAVARSPWAPGSIARRDAHRTTVAFVAVAAVTAAIPGFAWVSPSGQGGNLRPVRVALVQGGGRRGTRAIFTDPQVVFDRHLAASASIDSPVDLVVWPEGVLQSGVPFRGTADASDVARLALRLGATVVVGVEQDVGSSRYINEVVAWSPHGRIVATYQKNHLVPFGEYVPYRSLLRHLFNLADVPLDAIPGHQVGYMSTPAGGLGVMISYEDFFDERARGGVRAGGQLLVVPTNTSSYRSTQVPTQEVAASRIRAWETGRWLVQVTPVGYTTVVGPEGQVDQRSTLDEQTVVYATVPRETGRTVYVDVGPVPFALGALALAVLAWVLAWPGRRQLGGGHHDTWSAHP